MDLPAPTLAAATPTARLPVAVIGAGFTGTIMALNLLRVLRTDQPILLCERGRRFGCGTAYATRHDDHLLNVRAANMSAFADRPDDFVSWLHEDAFEHGQRVRSTPAGVFASRSLYGQYLGHRLEAGLDASGDAARLRLIPDEVIDVAPAGAGWRLTFAESQARSVAAVVLAIGNLRCPDTDTPVLRSDPWDPSALHGLRSGLPVLLIGTGLTAMDLVMSLHGIGLPGPVLALSRRGLLPQPHVPSDSWPSPVFAAADSARLLPLLRAVRREVARAAASGIDWRGVIDALRPQTQALWRGLPVADRARFLRHLRPYWDVHRHRVAPPVAAQIEALRASGYLRILRARLRGVEQSGGIAHAVVQRRGAAPERIAVQRVINATGIASAARCRDTLLRALLARRLVRLDPLGLGIDVGQDFRVLDAEGRAAETMWALGPIVRGVFWECVAVPDIRLQASQLAMRMAQPAA